MDVIEKFPAGIYDETPKELTGEASKEILCKTHTILSGRSSRGIISGTVDEILFGTPK